MAKKKTERIYRSGVAYQAAVLSETLRRYASAIERAPDGEATAGQRDVVTKLWALMHECQADTVGLLALVHTLGTARYAIEARISSVESLAGATLAEIRGSLPSCNPRLNEADVAAALAARAKWEGYANVARRAGFLPRDAETLRQLILRHSPRKRKRPL